MQRRHGIMHGYSIVNVQFEEVSGDLDSLYCVSEWLVS
jgi:hypothetical protein